MKKKYISILLIIIGIAIISLAIFMRYNGYIKQKEMVDNFEKTINDLNKEEQSNISRDKEKKQDFNLYKQQKKQKSYLHNQKNKYNSNSNNQPKKYNANSNFKGTIGIMKIPKIDFKVAIGDGIDRNTLKYTVGHFPNTPYPGEKGNSAIAGHRSYTYNEHFNRLDEVVEGDEIIIKTKKGEFTYVVYKKNIVLPEEVSVLNNTSDSELTLITCTPIRVATHRLIIKAKLNI